MKLHFIFRGVVAMIALTSLLAACGQRGPLYLPEKGKPKKTRSSTAKKVETAKPQAPGSVKPENTAPSTPSPNTESEEHDE